MERVESIMGLEKVRNGILQRIDHDKPVIRVCMTGCRAYGAADVRDALSEEVIRKGLVDDVEIRVPSPNVANEVALVRNTRGHIHHRDIRRQRANGL